MPRKLRAAKTGILVDVATQPLKPDLILTLDATGVIQDARVSPADIDSFSSVSLIGQRLCDTCETSNAAKAERLVQQAIEHEICGYSQINQKLPGGDSALFEFVAVRGDSGQLTVIGKNMQTVVRIQERLLASQRAIESEIWKLRELEARYTTLVNANSDAVIVVRDPDLQVIDANTQARRNIGLSVGDSISELVLSEHDSNRLQQLIETARQSGRAPLSIMVAGVAQESWRLRVSCYSSNASVQFLLQFSVHNLTRRLGNAEALDGISFSDILTHLPDGMVAVNADDMITHVNQAFATLVNQQNHEQMLGEPIHRWLKTSDSTISVLRDRLSAEERISDFPGYVHTTDNTERQQVILSAKRLAADETDLMLMVVRPVAA